MARTAPQARATKDAALQLLRADHEEVKVLFDEFEDTDDPRERIVVADRLRGLLTVHATIEEELFYPALREALDDDNQRLLAEATVEHETARELIAKLESASPDDARYAALVKVLGEYVRHHVEEEEDEVFPRARAAKLDQASLAAAMLERKQALMTELGLGDDEEEEVADDEEFDEDEDDEEFDADEDDDEDDDEDEDEDEDEDGIEEQDEEDALDDEAEDDEDADEDEDEEDEAEDEEQRRPARRSSGR
jgi:hemerythrin superfamily protein